MATVLVTGAAGFIASQVIRMLLDSGYTVVGLDNLNDAYDVRLKEWRLQQLRGRPGFEFHQLDIGDALDWQAGWTQGGRFEAVVNLAARAGVRQSLETPHEYLRTNLLGTLNLLEACRMWGVKKFILASTSSLYGADNPVPFVEAADTNRPLSPYAASKKAAEALCYTYYHLYGIDTTVFRYFTVYGPAGRPDMSIFRFIQWISEGRPVVVFGDGQQSRDFTYVDDIARGTVAGLSVVGYETINLGSDRPLRLLEVIRLIERCVGREAKIEFRPRHSVDAFSTWADISRAQRRLGWRPAMSFEQGLQATVSWYQANRDWASKLSTA